MGLDLYLYRKVYVSPEMAKPIQTILGVQQRIDGVIVEEIYWRKANAIHGWFVENVQDGIDDCRSYPVTVAQLRNLLECVKTVLAGSELVPGDVCVGTTYSPNGEAVRRTVAGQVIKDASLAQKLLPTRPGFFFGSTDYDQMYIDDLKYTKDELERVLTNHHPLDEFFYQSSW